MQSPRCTPRIASLEEDLGELYEIESQVTASSPHVLDTGGPEAFRDFLTDGGTALASIWSDEAGTAVGYLALLDREGSRELEIRSIAVLPQMQGTGIGSAMLASADRCAAERGRRRLVLATSPQNTGAINFYERHGFAPERVEADYYGDGTARQILARPVGGG